MSGSFEKACLHRSDSVNFLIVRHTDDHEALVEARRTWPSMAQSMTRWL